MAGAAITQGVFLILREPYLIFSIVGRTIASQIRSIGGKNITLVVQQNIDVGSSYQNTKNYNSTIGMINQAISFPTVLIFMFLIVRVRNLNFLLCTLILTAITGFGMALTVHNAGRSMLFNICFLASEVIDNATVIILLTMLNNKMELESRGVITGLAQVIVQLGGIILGLLNSYILGAF